MATPVHIFKTARRQMRKIRHRGPKTETERKLLASADQQREQGLGWRYDGFADVSTSEILAALKRCSIALDEEGFRAEAREAGSPTALWARWEPRSTAEGRWRDLPLLAARELWRRLLPEARSAEVVSDSVDDLLERAEVASDKRGLWFQAARLLLEACKANGAPDKDFFTAVAKESGTDLAGWLLEMPAALLGSEHAPEAPGLCEAFACLVDPKAPLAERAEILAHLGRREEAVAQLEALLAQYPGDPVVLLKAGAAYEVLGDQGRAQAYLKQYTLSLDGPKAASSLAAAAKAGLDLPGAGRLPSPNDKCPCGSGKKYKRCHGLPS